MAIESFFDGPDTVELLQRSVEDGWEVALITGERQQFDVEFCFPLPTFKQESNVVGDLGGFVYTELLGQDIAQGFAIALQTHTNQNNLELPHFAIKMNFPIDNRFVPFLSQVSKRLIDGWLQEDQPSL